MHLAEPLEESNMESNGTSERSAQIEKNGRNSSKTPRQRSPIQSWLFPNEEDLAEFDEDDDDDDGDDSIPSLTGRRWIDANLNEEQKVSADPSLSPRSLTRRN